MPALTPEQEALRAAKDALLKITFEGPERSVTIASQALAAMDAVLRARREAGQEAPNGPIPDASRARLSKIAWALDFAVRWDQIGPDAWFPASEFDLGIAKLAIEIGVIINEGAANHMSVPSHPPRVQKPEPVASPPGSAGSGKQDPDYRNCTVCAGSKKTAWGSDCPACREKFTIPAAKPEDSPDDPKREQDIAGWYKRAEKGMNLYETHRVMENEIADLRHALRKWETFPGINIDAAHRSTTGEPDETA